MTTRGRRFVKSTARHRGDWHRAPDSNPSKFSTGKFVAWDGEGSTDERSGAHRYVLLMNSEGGELCREDGISTREALTFLTAEAQRIGPEATHVGFGFSYDSNMMLRDTPRLVLKDLWRGRFRWPVHGFLVRYVAGKSLWVRRGAEKNGARLTIWDTLGFYQMSFLKAVEENLGLDDPRLPNIRKGKARRASFRIDDLPFIRSYTHDELTALVDLMGTLRDALVQARLPIRRWDGAGAIGAALLERERMDRHLCPCPSEVHEAALYCYGGGRAEMVRYGFHDGPVEHVDIRSAYPFAACGMPSLARGRWRSPVGDTTPGWPFAQLKVRWDLLGSRRTVFPFLFRAPNGTVSFPPRGETWVWRPEWDAAMEVPDLRRGIETLACREFVPDDPDERPFEWLRGWYGERRRLKEEGKGAQKPLKLGSNAVPGKLAQTVGGTAERPPKWNQMEYAGFVTSTTRAALFRMAESSGDGTIMLATDGIVSLHRIPGVRVGNELGEVERGVYTAFLAAQSGVYWAREEDPPGTGCPKCHGDLDPRPLGAVRCRDPVCGWTNLVERYRGFDPDSLDPDAIRSAWRRKREQVEATSTRFIGMGRASGSEKAFILWRRWMKERRTLMIRPTGKRGFLRHADARREWVGRRNPAHQLLLTDAVDWGMGVSTPYLPKFAEAADAEHAPEREDSTE